MLTPTKGFHKRFILRAVLTTLSIVIFLALYLYLSPALSEEKKSQHRIEICDTLILEYDKNEALISENETKEDQIIECLTKKVDKIADIPRNVLLTKATQRKIFFTNNSKVLYTLRATESPTKRSKSIGVISVRLKSEDNAEKIRNSELDTLVDKYINNKIQSEIKEKLHYCPKEVIFDEVKLFCVPKKTDVTSITNRLHALIRVTDNNPITSAISIEKKIEEKIESVSIFYDFNHVSIENNSGEKSTNKFLLAKVTEADLKILSPEEFNFFHGTPAESHLVDLALMYKSNIVQALERHKLSQNCLSSAQLVNPDSQALFCIKSWLGNDLSPKDRAEKAKNKIESLKANDIPPSSLGIVTVNSIRSIIETTDFRDILNNDQIADNSVVILADSESLDQDENIITVVTPNDAVIGDIFTEEESSPIRLAEDYLDIIKNYISKDKTSASVRFLGGLISFDDLVYEYNKKLDASNKNNSKEEKDKFDAPHPESIFNVQSSGEQFDASFRAWTIAEKLNDYIKNGEYKIDVYYQDSNDNFHKKECPSNGKINDDVKNIFIGFYTDNSNRNDLNKIMQVNEEDLKEQIFTSDIKDQILKYACENRAKIVSSIDFYKEALTKAQYTSLLLSSLLTIALFSIVEWVASSILAIKDPLEPKIHVELISSIFDFLFFLFLAFIYLPIFHLIIKVFIRIFNIEIDLSTPFIEEYCQEYCQKYIEGKIKSKSAKIFLLLLLLEFILLIVVHGRTFIFSLRTIWLLLPLNVMLSMSLEYVYFFGHSENKVESDKVKIVRWANRLIMRIIMILGILFSWIFYMKNLSYTHNWAQGLLEVGNRSVQLLRYYFVDNVPELSTTFALVALAVLILTGFIEKLISKSSRRNAAIALLWVFAIAFTIVIIAQHLPGAETPYFAGLSAFVLLAFSLSSQTLIADFITGIILIFFTEIDEGDWIEVCGICGEIKEQTVLVHRIRTSKHELITIPNNVVFNSKVTNYTAERDRSDMGPLVLSTSVTIGYDVSWRKVETLLLRSARDVISKMEIAPKKAIDKGDGKRCPYVLQTGLG